MNLSLAHYSKTDSCNIEEIEVSIVVVLDHLDLLERTFRQFDTLRYFSDSPVEVWDVDGVLADLNYAYFYFLTAHPNYLLKTKGAEKSDNY